MVPEVEGKWTGQKLDAEAINKWAKLLGANTVIG